MRLSASLAYATLFSIIPLLSLLVTIGVLLNIDFTNQLYAQLEPIVGSKVIDALQAIMENAETTDSFSFATIISIGVTIFGATTVFAEIQSSLNTIWGIKAVPKKSWLKYIINRLLSFSVILAFAFYPANHLYHYQSYHRYKQQIHHQQSGYSRIFGKNDRNDN